jgi:hypothetical protein
VPDFDRLAGKLQRSTQRRASIPIVYSRAGTILPGVTTGVFQREWMPLTFSVDEVPSTAPMIEVNLEDFGSDAPERSDEVSIRNGAEVFKVADVRPDGYGSAKLVLRLPEDPM